MLLKDEERLIISSLVPNYAIRSSLNKCVFSFFLKQQHVCFLLP